MTDDVLPEGAEKDPDERGMFRDEPVSEPPTGDGAGLHERCLHDRESMSPRETADCAGTELAEQYENEEDGGS